MVYLFSHKKRCIGGSAIATVAPNCGFIILWGTLSSCQRKLEHILERNSPNWMDTLAETTGFELLLLQQRYLPPCVILFIIQFIIFVMLSGLIA